MRFGCLKVAWCIVGAMIVAPLFLLALLARFLNKPIDIGLGPEPLINNVYHKKALNLYGYTAETFVTDIYYITSEFDRIFIGKNPLMLAIYRIIVLTMMMFRYRCLYIYFSGGPFGQDRLLWRIEAPLLKFAGVKIVVMPYGSDVQDMSLSPNLYFRHTYSQQYKPTLLRKKAVAARVDYWSRHAHHIIATGGLVYFMHVWDTLLPSYLSIDTEKWKPTVPPRTNGPFRILHAPNHRHIKGTQHIIDAVEELRADGLDIELVLLERAGNDEIRAIMAEVDVVADQLIIGWYAMFALEGMAMGKPVLCYLRDDLKKLFVASGLLEPGELPFVECCPTTVKEAIKRLYNNRDELAEMGCQSRAFAERHNSLHAIGGILDQINKSIDVFPSTGPIDMTGFAPSEHR